jgi:hypothetical protein
MKRPDLDTLAWVNPACQQFRLTGQGNRIVRQVDGQDAIRLLRCRLCGEECSERRGLAWFKTKLTEAQAEALIAQLGAGGRGPCHGPREHRCHRYGGPPPPDGRPPGRALARPTGARRPATCRGM